MAISGLSEAQLKASELLASGESQVKTAKIVNVNPKTIQRWLKDDMFKADVERNVRLLKSKVDENILMNIEPIMKRLINIALNSDREDFIRCMYLCSK
jgi:DNA-binding CsgD family transcriptional regulator